MNKPDDHMEGLTPLQISRIREQEKALRELHAIQAKQKLEEANKRLYEILFGKK